jgi:pyrimidine-nucleoside phosphorylase/thymidine phosphorylase
MRIVDVIRKKRDGAELTREELALLVEGYGRNEVSDYQAAAFLMAVYFQSLSDSELADLTDLYVRSGVTVDLSELPGVKVDKHSTGGVGDKASLVVAPIVAAAGCRVPMISGRGLAHTGGTVDKLESIPGFNTALSMEQFEQALRTTGCAIIAQTAELAPADGKLYSLRDATGTVESIPLIAASIMSKKLVEGIDALLLDVKTGSGAFMKKQTEARRLAQAMVTIGRRMGKRMLALITDMDQPLGNAVGNALEVMEAVNTLQGKGPPDLTELSLELAARMLALADPNRSGEEARELANSLLADGSALAKFRQIIEAQGGDAGVIDAFERLPTASAGHSITTPRSGYVTQVNAEEIGMAAVLLGAGRERLDSAIDHAVGIVVERKVGEQVEAGESLCTLYYNDERGLEEVVQMVEDAFHIASVAPEPRPLIYEVIQ